MTVNRSCLLKKVFSFLTCIFLLINIIGCDAFVRKFTRKSKKAKAPEELVLAPEEWKGPQMTKEQQYRQYFNFWESWHDELINSFIQGRSQKKKKDCLQQAIKNLLGMNRLLNENKQKQLGIYLKQMDDLKWSVDADIYGTSDNSLRRTAERIKLSILKQFTYGDIKNDLL